VYAYVGDNPLNLVDHLGLQAAPQPAPQFRNSPMQPRPEPPTPQPKDPGPFAPIDFTIDYGVDPSLDCLSRCLLEYEPPEPPRFRTPESDQFQNPWSLPPMPEYDPRTVA